MAVGKCVRPWSPALADLFRFDVPTAFTLERMELRHGTDARECANVLHWLAVAARALTLGLNPLEGRICHH
jgi:hypothetical protein